eukprot:Lankesteria_metandrocarpae@DN3276_c0_g1_i1.p1
MVQRLWLVSAVGLLQGISGIYYGYCTSDGKLQMCNIAVSNILGALSCAEQPDFQYIDCSHGCWSLQEYNRSKERGEQNKKEHYDYTLEDKGNCYCVGYSDPWHLYECDRVSGAANEKASWSELRLFTTPRGSQDTTIDIALDIGSYVRRCFFACYTYSDLRKLITSSRNEWRRRSVVNV